MRVAKAAAVSAAIVLSAPLAVSAADYADGMNYGGGYSAATDWSGPYAGAVLGYGWGDVAGGDVDGFALGLTLGHNWQQGQLVYGVEGDVSYSGVGYNGFGDSYEVDWVGTVRGRIGYAFDRFVAYGTAGIAWVNADYRTPGGRDSNTHLGWAFGVGAEMQVWDNVSAKAEYLYVDVGRETYDAGPDLTLSPDMHLLRVGLNYRF